jgi:hypothetical protein
MSSQYSVRGGNFDENLIYVNDIQIYRPILIRSGKQEGLSFINSDMVEDVKFSAGGFEAKYGDKMASVLDVKYKEPEKFGAGLQLSLLGANIFFQDASENHRFTQIHGIRYKTNKYLLNSLDVQGNYTPKFFDYQTYLTYDLSDNLEIGFLGNIAVNQYRFVPENQETILGTVQIPLKFTVFFEGQEIDAFNSYFGAVNLNYKPRRDLKLKFVASNFYTREKETYDIEGAYRLDVLQNDISKDNFGDVAFNLGVGGYISHARNFLDAWVSNFTHSGIKTGEKGTLLWGVSAQREEIYDIYKQWEYLDSAGYSLPRNPPDQIVLSEYYNKENHVVSYRNYGYLQHNRYYSLKDTSEITLSIGARYNYWTLNNRVNVSPRVNFSYKPNWKRDFLFRAAVGVYHQPPFYREFRDFQGNLNFNIKSQYAIHYILGSDYNFTLWNRPFKLVNEVYFKQFYNLIPYEINNVRIRYYADNISKGYAIGTDLKINGEFVKGMESWASLGVMSIKEDILNDYYYEYYNQNGEKIIFGVTEDDTPADSVKIEPGYIPRPTDQRVTIGLFFQDFIPKLPTYKMHLNLLFGSGLPFGPPTYERYKDTLRMPPYRRVDIGFSKLLIHDKTKLKENSVWQHFQSLWISLEVFNLLQINNTISYLWIKDIYNRQFAIPNYLTSRRINLKITARF